MSVETKGQELVGRLFLLINEYETSPEALNCGVFAELYDRTVRAIELAGDDKAAAYSLDLALDKEVALDIDRSDLRCVISHTLAIHHRYFADLGRGFGQAYRRCEQRRVQQLTDLRYIRTYLIPLLHKPGAVGGNLAACLYLTEQIGRLENLLKSPVWDDEQADEFLRQEPTEIIYQLARRRIKYSSEKLTKVPGSLEQTLQKDSIFTKLLREHKDKTPLLVHQIFEYGYSKRESIWVRMRLAIQRAFRGVVERMAGEYLAYELTRRKGAYIVQVSLMILILLGLFVGLFGLSYQSGKRWRQIGSDIAVANDMINNHTRNTKLTP